MFIDQFTLKLSMCNTHAGSTECWQYDHGGAVVLATQPSLHVNLLNQSHNVGECSVLIFLLPFVLYVEIWCSADQVLWKWKVTSTQSQEQLMKNRKKNSSLQWERHQKHFIQTQIRFNLSHLSGSYLRTEFMTKKEGTSVSAKVIC